MSFPADWLHHHRQVDCLTILPMSFILGAQSRQCSKLTSNFPHHIVCLERQLWILRWHLIYGYNNLLLHHSLGLMSSPRDCILMEPLDKICRDHHQHFDPFQDTKLNSLWEIPSLPSMICVIIDHFTAFPPTQTCSCFVLYLRILAIQHLFLTLEYYHLLCQECRENFTTS